MAVWVNYINLKKKDANNDFHNALNIMTPFTSLTQAIKVMVLLCVSVIDK